MNELTNIANMILIGSTARNNGKTAIATSIIEKLKADYFVVGLKITSSDGKNEKCIRGNHGCGVCSEFSGNFELTEELSMVGKKDTAKLLAAGADQVYWLKTLKSEISQGFNEFLRIIPAKSVIICESNTLRKYIKPSFFIMVTKTGERLAKTSALEVMDQADIVIENESFDNFEVFMNDIYNIIRKKRLIA